MIYRKQTPSFRYSEFPLSASAFPFLLKPRYRNINIGDLFEYLAKILWSIQGVRTSSVNFSLVNLCSPFSKFSHGASPTPPKEAWPNNPHLIFTFALSIEQDYAEDLHIDQGWVRHRSINVKQWGLEPGSIAFLSIGLNSTECSRLGLTTNLQANNLQYIYNLIGAMTKSLLRRHANYTTDGSSYDELHARYNLISLHSHFFKMPLIKLFTSVPYQLWVFNEFLWKYAPNCIPSRLITPQVALYYFMYLTELAKHRTAYTDILTNHLGLRSGISEGIAEMLSDSLISFVESIRAPSDTELSTQELLAPAVLQAALTTGKSKIEVDQNYKKEIQEDAQSLINGLRKNSTDFSSLFTPPDQVARKLMLEDPNYSNRLLESIDLTDLGLLDVSLSYLPREVFKDRGFSVETILIKMALTFEAIAPDTYRSKYELSSKFSGWTGPNLCHGAVVRKILSAKHPTDQIVLFGLPNGDVSHSILVDEDNNVLADTYTGTYIPGVGYEAARGGMHPFLKSISVKEFLQHYLSKYPH